MTPECSQATSQLLVSAQEGFGVFQSSSESCNPALVIFGVLQSVDLNLEMLQQR